MTQAIGAKVAVLERTNYLAMQPWVAALPGCSLTAGDDAIVTQSRLFAMPDLHHACLLRTTEDGADRLIDRVIGALQGRGRTAHVFVSPACTPGDIGERLIARGFRKEENEEPWLQVDLRGWLPPPVGSDDVGVARAGPRDARTFARVYLASFGMAAALAPLAALLFKRLMQVPSTRYAMASIDGQAAGVCLWHSHGDIVALGGMGVLPRFRGSRIATTLGMRVMLDAQAEGKTTIVAQMIHPGFEEFVSQYGFQRVFTRTHYVLPG